MRLIFKDLARPSCRIALLMLGIAGHASADSLAPPPYEVYDRHGVNLASGNVSPQLVDVSIGDAKFGLSHSISTYSSSFVNWDGAGPIGFRDRFYGGALKSVWSKPVGMENTPSGWIYSMKVFDVDGSFDFGYSTDGTTYTAMNGDPRNTLVSIPGVGLLWTKPDGTAVTFGGTGYTGFNPVTATIDSGMSIVSIAYPSGFTINVFGTEPAGGATTNTGYELRYVYVANNSPVDNDDTTNWEIPPALSADWSSSLPAYVVAINNTVDYCALSTSQSTSVAAACPGLTKPWPTASYAWPNGMPRAMYLRDNSFKVTDSMGHVTEFMHHPYTKPAVLNDPLFRVPRLVGIKSWNATTPYLQYDYTTKVNSQDTDSGMGFGYPIFFAGAIAQLSSSTYAGDTIGYNIAQQYQYAGEWLNWSGDPRGVNDVLMDVAYGIWEITAWDRRIELERNPHNRVTSMFEYAGGITTTFVYDARYNITSILKNGVTVQTALYPTTCTNPKTCNQATWVKDANGNETDFEYEPNSGQVSRIRYPADKSGIRPEKRMTYSPLYAYYKNSSGTFQNAPKPIYMLTEERKCIASATLADGSGCSAGGSDEVVTDYDYGPAQQPNNLQLRGTTVKAYVGGLQQVHRSCYSYDVYGNKIGETTPNASLASCY